MKKLSKRKLLHGFGVAVALCVPAVVVAQFQQNPPPAGTFAPGQVLRASQLEALRAALASAIARIDQLENRNEQGSPVLNVYAMSSDAASIEPNGVVDRLQSGVCAFGDLPVSCSCDGSVAAIQIERFVLDRTSRTCNCTFYNSNQAVRQTVRSTVNCLDITP